VYNESFIYVDQQGKRFLNELGLDNHSLPWPFRQFDPVLAGYPRSPGYFIFDENARLAGPVAKDALGYNRREWQWSEDNSAEVERGWIAKGDTPEELAAVLGIDGSTLAETFHRYNESAKNGYDPEFGRAAELTPPLEPPLYGIALWPCLLNTQGGPRHVANWQVVDYRGEPIPGLFTAGELGSIWTDLYPGGGNLIEAIVSGRIAGKAVLEG
jgi:succinate dehydrogenase/fumarate reductase flavoprotein subunit